MLVSNSPKRRLPLIGLHCVISQKIEVFKQSVRIPASWHLAVLQVQFVTVLNRTGTPASISKFSWFKSRSGDILSSCFFCPQYAVSSIFLLLPPSSGQNLFLSTLFSDIFNLCVRHNDNNISVRFFIIYVPSQQLQSQLQTQHGVGTGNYIMGRHNIKSRDKLQGNSGGKHINAEK
jgi:hypothetical protein